jgi:hypothetical protein
VIGFFRVGNGADYDGDGLSDTWEAEHGLNPSSPSDAGADSDADGLTNLEEFQRGLDPADDDLPQDQGGGEFNYQPARRLLRATPGGSAQFQYDGEGNPLEAKP